MDRLIPVSTHLSFPWAVPFNPDAANGTAARRLEYTKIVNNRNLVLHTKSSSTVGKTQLIKYKTASFKDLFVLRKKLNLTWH
jgi:hypothetical protein